MRFGEGQAASEVPNRRYLRGNHACVLGEEETLVPHQTLKATDRLLRQHSDKGQDIEGTQKSPQRDLQMRVPFLDCGVPQAGPRFFGLWSLHAERYSTAGAKSVYFQYFRDGNRRIQRQNREGSC